jgi:hypothetical protein
MDDRDQPGFRLALEAWLEQQPDWAVRLRDDLQKLSLDR